MNIRVLLFAAARRWVGTDELFVSAAEGARAGDVYLEPRLAGLLSHRAALRLAVNEEFVAEAHLLKDGDVVAVLPPVSGG